MRPSRLWAALRRHWRALLSVHLLFVLLGTALLTPLSGLLLRGLLALSGNEAVADQEIIMVLLTPLGLASAVLVLSVALAIAALEIVALLAIVVAARDKQVIHAPAAALFALHNARRILLTTIHLVIRVLAYLVPYLALVGVIAWLLLTDHDINYYLAQRPPAFYYALAGTALPTLLLAWMLGGRLLDWSLVLPLALFDDVQPGAAFKRSRKLVNKYRRVAVAAAGTWVVVVITLVLISAALLDLAWGFTVSLPFERLATLVLLLGAVTLGWLALGTVTSALSLGALAIAIGWLYSQLAPNNAQRLRESLPDDLNLSLRAPGVILSAGLLVFAAGGAGWWLLKSIPVEDDVLIVAHRGAAGAAPENTLAAVQRALDDGADWVEIDVQETRDGEVIVVHDSDFMKLAQNPLRVWNGDLEEIRQLDIGSWFDPEFADQRVPTLAEVLETVRGRAKLVIELKYYGHDEQLEQRVIDVVEAAGMADEIVLMSLNFDGIRRVRELRPDWTAGLLAAQAIGDLSRKDVDFLAVNSAMASRGFIRRAHAADKPVFVWTINEAAALSAWMSRGVDGIITDEPALARQVLEERARFGPAERLLLSAAMLFGKPAPLRDYRDDSP